MTLHRADWNWFGLVVVAWVGLFGLVYTPASFWFDVRYVRVNDSVAGIPPVMEVDRAIHRDFRADWTATVMRKGAGGFSTFCVARGGSDYRPDASLPDDLDLDWWTWPTKCVLPPGTYRVKTLWVLHLPIFPDKEVRSTSNVFEVR